MASYPNSTNPIAALVSSIRALPAAALVGFIDDATALLAKGEVDADFGDWVEVALDRLDELADGAPQPC